MRRVLLFTVILAVNFHVGSLCPYQRLADAKAAHKSGEIQDQVAPVTIEKIKQKLKEAQIFDPEDPSLSDRERKELSKLFDAVEIMTSSRNRQPSNVQNMFSSLRIVERAVKKQLKEGQISDSLANKFNWDKLNKRERRAKPAYYMDETSYMRMFNT